MQWYRGGTAHCNRRSRPNPELDCNRKNPIWCVARENLNVDAKMEPGTGRKPGVACNKHQGRELKTSTISFQNLILHNMHQTTASNKTKQGFLAIVKDQRWLL